MGSLFRPRAAGPEQGILRISVEKNNALGFTICRSTSLCGGSCLQLVQRSLPAVSGRSHEWSCPVHE